MEQAREGDFKATVDLSQTHAGEQQVSVQVKCTERQVRVVSIHPSTVNVSLEAVKEQIVPVRVNIQNVPAFGYTSEPPRPEVEQVTVYGPEGLVSQVDYAVAYIDLEGAKVSVKQTFPLSARTTRGYEVQGVILEPSSVAVEIPIKQQIDYQSFAIGPEAKGVVAYGYWGKRSLGSASELRCSGTARGVAND